MTANAFDVLGGEECGMREAKGGGFTMGFIAFDRESSTHPHMDLCRPNVKAEVRKSRDPLHTKLSKKSASFAPSITFNLSRSAIVLRLTVSF